MSASQDKRVWLAGGALLCVVIVAAAWLAMISPKISSTKSVRTDTDSARTQNVVLETKVAKLKLANDNVGDLTASLRVALAALPPDSGLPAFTRQVSGQASRVGVALRSIAVGAVAPAGKSTPAPTTGTATTGTATSGTATSGTATTTGTATTAASAAVVAIPITLVSAGGASAQLAFLQAIQVTGPRRALVTSVALGDGASGGSSSASTATTMTLQLTVFSAPLSAAALGALEQMLAGK